MKNNTEHPEVKDIQNICNISPNAEETKQVCKKVNQAKTQTVKQKFSGNKNRRP